MLRRQLLAMLAASPGLPQSRRRPNIVMILCDDLGYGDPGCYGNRIIHTPNIDALALRGTRFSAFYSASPVCSPSRTALMTGHYPQRYGIHHADVPESLPRYLLPGAAVTIAEVLHEAGYFTAHVGKWHLGEPPEAPEPRRQGFDYFFGNHGGRPSSGWIRYARSQDPELVLNEERPKVYRGHITDVQTAAALEILEKHGNSEKRGGDKPLFLNLWYNAPHEPLAPIVHQADLYRHWSKEEQTYFQTVTDMDAGVGKILAKLKELGIENETLVMFSSDNGPEAHSFQYSRGSAGGLKGMKTQLWEGGIRVPGILCWPGVVPAGRVYKEPARMFDLFPTFVAASGAKMPADLRLDGGVNLLPIVQGKAGMPDRALVWEFHSAQRGVESSLPMCVRRGRWKLFSDFAFEKKQLYDLESDPGENRDVSGSNASIVARLSGDLKAWHTEFASKLDLDQQHTRVPVPVLEELEKRYYHNF